MLSEVMFILFLILEVLLQKTTLQYFIEKKRFFNTLFQTFAPTAGKGLNLV